MYRITQFFEFLRARFEIHKTVWLTAFLFLSLHRNGLCVLFRAVWRANFACVMRHGHGK